MEEKRTGLFEKRSDLVRRRGFDRRDPDRNISGPAWHGKKDWRQS